MMSSVMIPVCAVLITESSVYFQNKLHVYALVKNYYYDNFSDHVSTIAVRLRLFEKRNVLLSAPSTKYYLNAFDSFIKCITKYNIKVEVRF